MSEDGTEIRHPGFAFVNVLSPCVTFGSPETQLREHKTGLQRLDGLGHDAADRNAAEVGGCSAGPDVIDFTARIIWTCEGGP